MTRDKSILKLYGSKKFDDLTIQKLVKEMRKYKSKVVKKINENKNEKAGKNYGFESCDEKVILTPLASREKENTNFTDTIAQERFELGKSIKNPYMKHTFLDYQNH